MSASRRWPGTARASASKWKPKALGAQGLDLRRWLVLPRRVQLEDARRGRLKRDEQTRAYPVISRMLGGEDPIGAFIQTHQEIQRLARLLGRLISQLPVAGPTPADVRDLRRILYGLHAILVLHFAQEDELYAHASGSYSAVATPENR